MRKYQWDTNEYLCEKRNEKNEFVKYKARLVVHGFTQRPKINYGERTLVWLMQLHSVI